MNCCSDLDIWTVLLEDSGVNLKRTDVDATELN